MADKTTQAQVLAQRMFTAGVAAAELMTTYLGVRLALYEELALSGPLTPGRLAERAGIAPRYAREWLEQQAVAGILEVDDTKKSPDDRLYLLPEGHREALTDNDSLFWIAPMAILPVGGIMEVLPHLVQAYRSGAGVPFAKYGSDLRGGQSGLNRPIFLRLLGRWIRTFVPEIHARLLGGESVADIGCGTGWSSIALARAYPQSCVDGFDIDEPSIEIARRNADTAGVSDRVHFYARDASTLPGAGTYGLVCIFDALHDMPRPVEILRACRTLLDRSGVALLMEPNAAEVFNAPADETQRFLYAISVLHCLPVGMSEQPSAATGTVMRPETVRAYANQAGFADVTVQPVDHRFYRLYCLRERH
jgi:2-polyprenyl-3-methyl-5-hydroxy-6-metoxy-1,4-benzoquinol methylase